MSSPTFPIELFTWTGKIGTAELSDLVEFRSFESSDSFYVESKKTGTILRFESHNVVRDADGDITHWGFISEPHPFTKEKFGIKIYND